MSRVQDVVFARENDWMDFVASNKIKERYMSNLLNCSKVRYDIVMIKLLIFENCVC